MSIPRLRPHTASIDVTITVNKKLSPYFDAWFRKHKESGEKPANFALRMLKNAALSDYLSEIGVAEAEAIERTKENAQKALQADADVMNAEVD